MEIINLNPTVSWNNVADKPTTFTPSTHNHFTSQWIAPAYSGSWQAGPTPLVLRRNDWGFFLVGSAKITFSAGMVQFSQILSLPANWSPIATRYAPVVMTYLNTVVNSFVQFLNNGAVYCFLPSLPAGTEITLWLENFLVL